MADKSYEKNEVWVFHKYDTETLDYEVKVFAKKKDAMEYFAKKANCFFTSCGYTEDSNGTSLERCKKDGYFFFYENGNHGEVSACVLRREVNKNSH